MLQNSDFSKQLSYIKKNLNQAYITVVNDNKKADQFCGFIRQKIRILPSDYLEIKVSLNVTVSSLHFQHGMHQKRLRSLPASPKGPAYEADLLLPHHLRIPSSLHYY